MGAHWAMRPLRSPQCVDDSVLTRSVGGYHSTAICNSHFLHIQELIACCDFMTDPWPQCQNHNITFLSFSLSLFSFLHSFLLPLFLFTLFLVSLFSFSLPHTSLPSRDLTWPGCEPPDPLSGATRPLSSSSTALPSPHSHASLPHAPSRPHLLGLSRFRALPCFIILTIRCIPFPPFSLSSPCSPLPPFPSPLPFLQNLAHLSLVFHLLGDTCLAFAFPRGLLSNFLFKTHHVSCSSRFICRISSCLVCAPSLLTVPRHWSSLSLPVPAFCSACLRFLLASTAHLNPHSSTSAMFWLCSHPRTSRPAVR